MKLLLKAIKYNRQLQKTNQQRKAKALRQTRLDDRNAMLLPFALGITGVVCACATYTLNNISKK